MTAENPSHIEGFGFKGEEAPASRRRSREHRHRGKRLVAGAVVAAVAVGSGVVYTKTKSADSKREVAHLFTVGLGRDLSIEGFPVAPDNGTANPVDYHVEKVGTAYVAVTNNQSIIDKSPLLARFIVEGVDSTAGDGRLWLEYTGTHGATNFGQSTVPETNQEMKHESNSDLSTHGCPAKIEYRTAAEFSQLLHVGESALMGPC